MIPRFLYWNFALKIVTENELLSQPDQSAVIFP